MVSMDIFFISSGDGFFFKTKQTASVPKQDQNTQEVKKKKLF